MKSVFTERDKCIQCNLEWNVTIGEVPGPVAKEMSCIFSDKVCLYL